MSAASAIPVNPTLSQRFAGLDPGQRLRMGMGLALLVAIGIIGLMMGRQAEWRVLSANPTRPQRFAGPDPGERLRMAMGLALFVAIGIIGLMMGRQAEWRVLYANLADKDGGA